MGDGDYHSNYLVLGKSCLAYQPHGFQLIYTFNVSHTVALLIEAVTIRAKSPLHNYLILFLRSCGDSIIRSRKLFVAACRRTMLTLHAFFEIGMWCTWTSEKRFFSAKGSSQIRIQSLCNPYFLRSVLDSPILSSRPAWKSFTLPQFILNDWNLEFASWPSLTQEQYDPWQQNFP
jgi:hypothetical protein